MLNQTGVGGNRAGLKRDGLYEVKNDSRNWDAERGSGEWFESLTIPSSWGETGEELGAVPMIVGAFETRRGAEMIAEGLEQGLNEMDDRGGIVGGEAN